MQHSVSKIAFEQVANLVMNFGWQVVKQEVKDRSLYITLKKEYPNTLLTEATEGSK